MIGKQVRASLLMVLLLTILTGFAYPLAMTGIAQLLFPHQANGSLLTRGDSTVGSSLIGQEFTNPGYFWGRLSATTPNAYNAASSTGSNYGPLNPALLDMIRKRIQDLRAVDSSNRAPIPVDLVTASGSGLDPHISVAAAMYQAPRVARYRHASVEKVRSLIDRFTEGRTFGFLGEPRVNVLELNLALDERSSLSEAQ